MPAAIGTRLARVRGGVNPPDCTWTGCARSSVVRLSVPASSATSDRYASYAVEYSRTAASRRARVIESASANGAPARAVGVQRGQLSAICWSRSRISASSCSTSSRTLVCRAWCSSSCRSER